MYTIKGAEEMAGEKWFLIIIRFNFNNFNLYHHFKNNRNCVMFCLIKGTVSVIASDPLCKYGNARFTTVPSLKALSGQV